jgi:adenylyltransferase/sulfurtransferase
VGTIGIVDRDVVALSNLHRQILHTAAEVGRPKSHSAKARLTALNPDITVHALQEGFSASTAGRLLAPYQLVLDGSDNFPTRYLVNDACVLAGVPLIHGGVVRLQGQVLMVQPKISACFRCVFPEPPEAIPSCQEAGVLGSVAGIVGTLMAHEALKRLTGLGRPLTDRLLVFDGLASRFREVPLRRNPRCAVCGDEPSLRRLAIEEEPVCGSGRQSVNESLPSPSSRQSDRPTTLTA